MDWLNPLYLLIPSCAGSGTEHVFTRKLHGSARLMFSVYHILIDRNASEWWRSYSPELRTSLARIRWWVQSLRTRENLSYKRGGWKKLASGKKDELVFPNPGVAPRCTPRLSCHGDAFSEWTGNSIPSNNSSCRQGMRIGK